MDFEMVENMERQWQWEEGSILHHIGPYSDTKEIFDATCREIVRHYSTKRHFKTYKKKIKWIGTYLNCELCFWSASWNTNGQSVCFDVVATMHANDTSGMERKGILGDLRYKYREIFNVYEIDRDMFFKIVDYIDEMVACVQSFDSYEGFKKHMEEDAEYYEMLGLESNGHIFLDRMIQI